MPVGKHEAIAIGPVWIRGVVLQMVAPENLCDIRHPHRHAGMSRVCLLNRVHGQETDGIRHFSTSRATIRHLRLRIGHRIFSLAGERQDVGKGAHFGGLGSPRQCKLPHGDPAATVGRRMPYPIIRRIRRHSGPAARTAVFRRRPPRRAGRSPASKDHP